MTRPTVPALSMRSACPCLIAALVPLGVAPTSDADITVTIEANLWVGEGDFLAPANWDFGGTIFFPDAPRPSLPTYLGPIEDTTNGLPAGFRFPLGNAELSANFDGTGGLNMVAYDQANILTLSGGTYTTNATIGSAPSNNYVPTGAVQPATVILAGGTMAGSWSFLPDSRLIVQSGTNTLNGISGSVGNFQTNAGATAVVTTTDFGVGGAITNNGVITFEDNTASAGGEDLDLFGETTFNGTGEIVLNNPDAAIDNGSGGIFNNGAQHTVRGQGAISVAGTNQGLIRAEGGLLSLVTTDNTGGNLEVASDGTLWFLGTTNNGTLTGEAGARVQGANFLGGTIEGQLAVTTTDFGVGGAITNNGVITFEDNTASAGGEDLDLFGETTFNGTGEIVLNNPDAAIDNGSGGIFNNGAQHTVRGQGAISVAGTNQGLIRAEGGLLSLVTTDNTGGNLEVASDGTLWFLGTTNNGTLTGEAGARVQGANFLGGTIEGQLAVTTTDFGVGGAITNNGVITFEDNTASAGGEDLDLFGETTFNGTGEIVLNNPDAAIDNGSGGIFNNGAQHTIRANAVGDSGIIQLPIQNDGLIKVESTSVLTVNTVTGGVIDIDAGGILAANQLSDVLIPNTFTVPVSDVGFTGVITNQGTIGFEDNASSNDEDINIFGQTTLTGTGEIVLNSSDSSRARIDNGSGGSIINDVQHTIRGNGAIAVPASNTGLIRAEGGLLSLTTADNTGGRIEVAGDATLSLSGTVSGGTLTGEAGARIQGSQFGDGTVIGQILVTSVDVGLSGVVTNLGTIGFEDSASSNDEEINIFGQTTLTGTGEIVLNSSDSSRARIDNGSGGSIVNGDQHTIRGNGDITVSASNTGLIRAEGGLLSLTTTDNTGGRIEVAADGTLSLSGVVNGGTLGGEPGARVQGSYFGDGTIEGEIWVTTTDFGLGGAITNLGTIGFEDSASSNDEEINIFGQTTFAGTGQIVLSSSDSSRARIDNGSGGSIINAGQHTIRGNGDISVPLRNEGFIEPGADQAVTDVLAFASLTLAEQGQLIFDLAGTAPGTEHDQISGGTLIIEEGEDLEVVFAEGYTPEAYDSFLLVAGSSVQGVFEVDVEGIFGADYRAAVTYGSSNNEVRLTKAIVGDASLDGIISQADLDAVLLNWGNTTATWATGDLTGDNFVSQADLDAVLLNWGDTVGTPSLGAVETIPEPGTLVLLGGAGLALVRRRAAA